MNLTRDEQDMKGEMDYRDEVQRELDDAEAKRAASGFSPEELSLKDAYIEGQKAGHLGLSASLNPYQDSTLEYFEWEKARSCVIGAFLNGGLRRFK